MADDREDVLKSLGVKRRRKPNQAEAEAPPEDASSSGSGGLGLGIKRRRKGGDEAPESSSGGGGGTGLGIKRRRSKPEDASEGGGGTGLGIKRRSGRQEAAAPAEAEEAAAPPPPPWAGKLGNDDAAVMLQNHFRARPEMPAMMPERVWDLHRTHGRYLGDGRPERKIAIGWEPAFVLYTLPPYPDGAPDVDPKTSKFVFPDGRPAYDPKTRRVIEPGPNKQPGFVEDGFVVPARLNQIGEWYMYIVWRSDGTPLEVEEPEAARAPAEKPSRSLGLGIKRRR